MQALLLHWSHMHIFFLTTFLTVFLANLIPALFLAGKLKLLGDRQNYLKEALTKRVIVYFFLIMF